MITNRGAGHTAIPDFAAALGLGVLARYCDERSRWRLRRRNKGRSGPATSLPAVIPH
jgi:hypothetical protein